MRPSLHKAALSTGTDTLEDGVDWHWDRILAPAAMTTLLGIGAELAAPENRQEGNRVILAGRDGLQDTVNQVGQEMTRRNMNIQPTLTSRRCVVWDLEEIESWVEARKQAARSGSVAKSTGPDVRRRKTRPVHEMTAG